MLSTFSEKALLAITLALFSSTALAAPVETPNVLGLDFQKRVEGGIKLDFVVKKVNSTALSNSIYRKRGVTSSLSNQAVLYLTEVEAGSNQQPIQVDIDTGSSDLWFPAANAVCQRGDCTSDGAYDPSTSTTSVKLSVPFSILYGDQSSSLGYYYTDSIEIGGVTLNNLEFGVANTTSVPQGILGVGLISGEATSHQYPNLPATLVSQGLISKNFYSLYLNGPQASTGSILFGGIDSTKYTGPLITVPILSKTRLSVGLGSVGFPDGSSISAGTSKPILDSGTTYTLLPPVVADAIASKFDFAYYDGQIYVVACNLPEGSFTYNFANGAQIQVPYSSVYQDRGGGFCTVNIGHSLVLRNGEVVDILGDNFLQSAYVVYDITDMTISLAQAQWS